MARNNPFTKPSLTKQSFGDEVNINSIAARAIRGQPIPMKDGVAMYGDFSNAGDLQTALERVRLAERHFMAIPGEVRARFEHDPVKYVEFMTRVEAKDPAVREEAILLGLVEATEGERRNLRLKEIEKAKARLAELEGPKEPETEEKEKSE